MAAFAKFAAALTLGISASAALAAPATFSSGAEVTIPSLYAFGLEEDGKTLVVHPKGSRAFELRLTFHSVVPHLKGRPNVAEEFIIKRAAELKLKLVRIPGTNRLGYMQHGEPTIESDGEQTSSLHTHFSIREGILVSTFTLPTKNLDTPVVQAFLHGQMEKILASLRYSGP